MKPQRYENLLRLIDEIRPGRILEIGVWRCHQALAMIERAQAYQETVEYWGFDLFEPMSDEMKTLETAKSRPALSLEAATALLATTGAEIHLTKGNTRQTLPQKISSMPPMDFIFIDGGHSVATIKSDWLQVAHLMHGRTVAVLDDVYPDDRSIGAQAVVDIISDHPAYVTRLLEPVDEIHGRRIQLAEIRVASRA